MIEQISELETEIMLVRARNVRLQTELSEIRKFLAELVTPEGLGHAVTKEVRKRAAGFLGD